MEKCRQNIEASFLDKVSWLANQIFAAFPQEVAGLKLYALDCGCIHYQRVFEDGSPDPQVGIYRDGEDGPCEICMQQDETWKERSLDEIIVYNSKFQVEIKGQ